MNKNEFNQWFVGFSDGESNFSITEDNRGKNTNFYFKFTIGLHIDDRPLLEFIQTELGCGSIINNKDNTASYFTVGDSSQIKIILIPIFESFPLNTTKYLDYTSFKQALFINIKLRNTSNLEIKDNYRKQILDLKNSINTKRTEFVLPLNHIKITPYWLLGLIEGEGSFHLWRTTLTPVFSISLTKVQQPVIEKIIEFLTNNLDKHSQFKAINTKVFNLSIEKARGNSKAKVKLAIFSNRLFI
jgi:LAGLIDADG endonuclease